MVVSTGVGPEPAKNNIDIPQEFRAFSTYRVLIPFRSDLELIMLAIEIQIRISGRPDLYASSCVRKGTMLSSATALDHDHPYGISLLQTRVI